jgi:hypothetical protein
MSAPTPTRPTGRALGEAIVEIVTAHPERHRQAVVVGQRFDGYGECGTSACIAGWACSLAIGLPVDDPDAMYQQYMDFRTWDHRLEELTGTREEDHAAFKLLFGEDALDEHGKGTDLFARFYSLVFSNMDEPSALRNLIAMLDEHYAT